jgi:hypothetical protein
MLAKIDNRCRARNVRSGRAFVQVVPGAERVVVDLRVGGYDVMGRPTSANAVAQLSLRAARDLCTALQDAIAEAAEIQREPVRCWSESTHQRVAAQLFCGRGQRGRASKLPVLGLVD